MKLWDNGLTLEIFWHVILRKISDMLSGLDSRDTEYVDTALFVCNSSYAREFT